MDPQVLAELKAIEAAGDFESPRYMELLLEHHYDDQQVYMSGLIEFIKDVDAGSFSASHD